MENITNVNHVLISLNQIFFKIFSSIDINLLNALDELVFIDSSILKDNNILKFLGSEFTNGTITIAISITIGLLLYILFKNLISYLTFKQSQNPLKHILKMILVLIIIVSIKEILTFIFYINTLIGIELLEIGKNIIGETRVSFETLILNFNKVLYSNSNIEIASFEGIIKIFSTIGLLNLLFEYSIRYILIKINCIISPIMIGISILQNEYNTTGIFKNWLKNFTISILMQNLILIILILTLSININEKDVLNKLIFLGTVYCLIKANRIVNETFGGNTVQNSVSLNSLIKGG